MYQLTEEYWNASISAFLKGKKVSLATTSIRDAILREELEKYLVGSDLLRLKNMADLEEFLENTSPEGCTKAEKAAFEKAHLRLTLYSLMGIDVETEGGLAKLGNDPKLVKLITDVELAFIKGYKKIQRQMKNYCSK